MKYVLFICSLAFGLQLLAQNNSDLQLAQYYFNNSEFDKALIYYQKLYESDQSKAIFTPYFSCLRAQKDDKTAEKVLKKQINLNRQDYEVRMLAGSFYEELNEAAKAKKVYEEILSELEPNPGQIIAVYQAFASKGKLDYAKKTLEQGKKLAPFYPFNFQFADLYALMGDKRQMMLAYLDYLAQQPSIIDAIQQAIGSRLDLANANGPDFLLAKEVLLQQVQQTNAPLVYSQMLIWLFVQNRDFNGAVTQVIALDKRSKGEGREVLEMGHICVENAVFDQAKRCYQYVMDLGQDRSNFYEAQLALLNARFQQITQFRNFTTEEISQSILDYEIALNRLGKGRVSFQLILQLAEIRAFYATQTKQAIEELQALIQLPGLTDMQRAQAKMLLADIFVLAGDIWEASLLYMQIDNDFKFETIGSEAKFKNAKIFYYDGEFEFAQAQLNVLKESTSKLISNDAIQLAVFITDNYGLDSNYQVMLWFATADRMIAQHHYDSAFVLFDSIQKQFPYHSLADDILYRKGLVQEQRGEWQKALGYYADLLKLHGKDILADDALFRTAEILELRLINKEEAVEAYKKLLLEYKSSLYGAEARKRIRLIRGDALSEGDEL
ncbi:MAG: tetratricopeptide repeat protein [Flavobacteriales bacterium]